MKYFLKLYRFCIDSVKKLFKPDKTIPTFFDIKEKKRAAKILGVCEKTLSNKIKKGDILYFVKIDSSRYLRNGVSLLENQSSMRWLT